MGGRSQDRKTSTMEVKESKLRLSLSDKYPGWKANRVGSIPCPPKEYGGCNHSSLNLSRIFKMNWVAKLVKNAEEMVSGCKVCDIRALPKSGLDDSMLCQYANREESDDNFLYCPSCEDIKAEGLSNFRKHWAKGEPIIVRQVFDSSYISSWDPMVIWRGIRETSDEKMKDENRIVKAVDCLTLSEVDIELDEFLKGYSQGRIREDGSLEMLKLKDWPSPSASEEFLVYQRPEFISKLPLLEYIHSRLGLLNVAAKLPHYSLQNDAGPKIYMSYGSYEELGRGDSVTNLHIKMRDMVYLLVHAQEVKLKGSEGNKSLDKETDLDEERLPDLSHDGQDLQNERSTTEDKDEGMVEDEETERNDDQGVETEAIGDQKVKKESGDIPTETRPGIHWDIFRRQDVSKLIDYLQKHSTDFGKSGNIGNHLVPFSLCDGTVFLNKHQMRNLKEEYGVEPWSFEQHLGQAVFVPAGCPFQARNLQSTVQLGLDFLSPESVGEAARLAEEIRCLPNDHEAKIQVLEVGKISLYAASSAIKEVQKLVLDPKLGTEIGFEDPNLTAAVSDNLEKVSKQREISCA